MDGLEFTSNSDGTCSLSSDRTQTGELVIPLLSPAGDRVTSIVDLAFRDCGLTSIYIQSSVTTISASDYSYSPFNSYSSSLKIYCGASSKPSGWGTYWNYYNSSTALSTTWGVTREQYNSQYA